MVLQRSQLLNVEIDKNYKDFVLCCDFHPARFLKLPRMARLPVALLLRASAWVREHQLSAQFQFSILNFPKECCSPPRLFPTSAGLSHIRPFPDVSPCWLATLSGSRSTPCNEDCSNSYWSAGGGGKGDIGDMLLTGAPLTQLYAHKCFNTQRSRATERVMEQL